MVLKSLIVALYSSNVGTVSFETVFTSIRDGYSIDQSKEMSTILGLIKQGRVKVPLSQKWDDAKSNWKESIKESGYIDLVGEGHMKGKLVMKIE